MTQYSSVNGKPSDSKLDSLKPATWSTIGVTLRLLLYVTGNSEIDFPHIYNI